MRASRACGSKLGPPTLNDGVTERQGAVVVWFVSFRNRILCMIYLGCDRRQIIYEFNWRWQKRSCPGPGLSPN